MALLTCLLSCVNSRGWWRAQETIERDLEKLGNVLKMKERSMLYGMKLETKLGRLNQMLEVCASACLHLCVSHHEICGFEALLGSTLRNDCFNRRSAVSQLSTRNQEIFRSIPLVDFAPSSLESRVADDSACFSRVYGSCASCYCSRTGSVVNQEKLRPKSSFCISNNMPNRKTIHRVEVACA